MNTARRLQSLGLVVCLVASIDRSFSIGASAQVPDKGRDLVGTWTLNQELSDAAGAPPAQEAPGQRGRNGGRGGGGGGGGRGHGGFGGGGRGGSSGPGGGASTNPDEAARLRAALRDLTNPPDHLTIVTTDTMVVLTGPDGRTTRLSPDGMKIKDENTSIERKTKWDGLKLVSEISGPGVGKAVETYFVDAEQHRLHLVAEVTGRGAAHTFTHVYDSDAR